MIPPLQLLPALPWAISSAELARYAVEGVVVAGMLTAGGIWNRTLRRRTRELRLSEERWRALFDHAAVAILEEDLRTVMARLGQLRAAGVTDLRAYLKTERAQAVEMFRAIGINAANRAALALFGCSDLERLRERMKTFAPKAPPEAFAEELVALWEGRHELQAETGFTGPDGVRRRGLLQMSVPVTEGQPDHARVLVTLVDLTQLRESEERFRALCDGAVEGIYESSPSGGFAEANPAFARMLGYETPAQLKALPPAELHRIYVHPGRRDEFFRLLGTGDSVTDFESEVRRSDGTTRWVSENVRAIRGADGQLLRLQGFVSDVTARRQAEVAGRASEERFRVLFEYSPVGIVEYDYRPAVAWLDSLRAAGVTDFEDWCDRHPVELQVAMFRVQIVAANSASLRLVGAKSLEEGIANVAKIFTPEAYAARRATFAALWEGRNDCEGELTLSALDGTRRRALFHWWVPAIDGGRAIARTQLVLVDVTDIRSAETALAAERERLSVTLRAMAEGVITTDPAGVIQYMNDAAAAVTGWPAGAAVGRPFAEICVLATEGSQRPVPDPVAAALTGDAALDLPARTVLRPRTGIPRLIEGRCAPLHGLAGRAIGAVLVLRDVTQRARMEAELLRASKLESVGVLAGGIAHDFNNLLAIVMGNLTLALLDERTKATGGHWLREAERGTARARELTQQLLTFAKGGEPVRTAVALPDVVREVAQFALHGTSVRCEFDLAADVQPADADKGQIGQVVQNLVLNAVQAMPAGGLIRITLRDEILAADAVPPLPAGDYLKLSISDTGKGIPPEQLPRIFEPFFTTKEHGSGLGLATVFSVIQKHRGQVTVESTVGRGTTFHLWLPAARAEPPKAVLSASPFEPLKGRILFMDDEEPIRTMTVALMARLGLEAVATADGDAAVQAYTEAYRGGQPFDAVIMDLTVQGAMGGAEAMRQILAVDPRARGIVSSGYSSDPVMANYRAHGFRGSVPKPYRVADFARTLREVLADR